MNLLATVAGTCLIFLGLYDLFRTLFLPAGKGLISKWTAHGSWRGIRRMAARQPGVLALGGPAAFIATVVTWGILIVVGFALVYRAWMPAGFSYDSLLPGENAGFLDALYLSVVTAATLGFGDITPDSPWLRIVVPLQALIGFLIWTATISWLLSIYPDLATRQVVAREASLLQDVERQSGIDLFSHSEHLVSERVLDKLVTGIVTVRGDLLQFPVTYYFYESDRRYSLPGVLPYILDVAGRASAESCPPAIRMQGQRLQYALDDLAQSLATRFLFVEDMPVASVFALYAEEHAPPAG